MNTSNTSFKRSKKKVHSSSLTCSYPDQKYNLLLLTLIKTMSAASSATLVPDPIAIPTLAWANAGESLRPSPTKATTGLPLAAGSASPKPRPARIIRRGRRITEELKKLPLVYSNCCTMSFPWLTHIFTSINN